jgi:oligopeptide/dipeptide ABC transporter ATP-binding protein
MCDRVAVMYLGKVVELASGEELYARPRHPYTGALLEAVPVPDPTLRERRGRPLGGDVPSPIDPPRACRFHTRCPKFVAGHCDVEEPLLADHGAGGLAACHYPLEHDERPAVVAG